MIDVPNIVQTTGVSRDYIRAFQTVEGYLRRIDKEQSPRSVRLARGTFLDRRILRYDEFFDMEEYRNVVNEFNRDVVIKLNSLVNRTNDMRDELKTVNPLPYDELLVIWNGVRATINGYSSC